MAEWTWQKFTARHKMIRNSRLENSSRHFPSIITKKKLFIFREYRQSGFPRGPLLVSVSSSFLLCYNILLLCRRPLLCPFLTKRDEKHSQQFALSISAVTWKVLSYSYLITMYQNSLHSLVCILFTKRNRWILRENNAKTIFKPRKFRVKVTKINFISRINPMYVYVCTMYVDYYLT